MLHDAIPPILGPVVTLAAWTMVMWLWMYATRIPAIARLPKPDAPGADVGWTGAMLEGVLPPSVQWKAHNYNTTTICMRRRRCFTRWRLRSPSSVRARG